MQCFNCQNSYNSTSYAPRLLLQCGHSLCESCTINLFKECLIICPECKTYNYAPTPQHFPKNLALLSVNKSVENEFFSGKTDSCENSLSSNNNNNTSIEKINSVLCSKHNKPIEAFCENDKQLLCITCILEDGHCKHEINSISNAAQNERNILSEAYKVCKILQDKIEDQLNQLEQTRIDIQRQDINNLNNIKQFFTELHKFLSEREQLINSKYKSIMNNFQNLTDSLSMDKKKQLTQISVYYQEYANSCLKKCEDNNKDQQLQDLNLLKGAPDRIPLILEATKEINELEINSKIDKFNHDGELSLIIKQFQQFKQISSNNSNSNTNQINQNQVKQNTQQSGQIQGKKKIQQSQIVQSQQPQQTQYQIQQNIQNGNYFNKKKGPIKKYKYIFNKFIYLKSKSKINNVKDGNKSTKFCDRSPVNLQSHTIIENNPKLKRGPSQKTLNANDQNIEAFINVLNNNNNNNNYPSKTPLKKNIDNLDLSTILQEKYQLISPPSSLKQDLSQFLLTSMSSPLDFSVIYQQQMNQVQESIFIFGGQQEQEQENIQKFEIEIYDNENEVQSYISSVPINCYLPVLIKSLKKIRLIPSEMSFNLITMQFEKEKIFQKLNHPTNNPTCLQLDEKNTKSLQNNILITGGTITITTLNYQQSNNQCTLYSIYNNNATNVASMNYHRSYHALTLGIDNKIYAIGGVGKQAYGSRSSSNSTNGEWKEGYLNSCEIIQPMKQKRAKHSVVTLPDAIYVFGGFDGENYLNSAEKYDFITQEWSFITPMKEKRCSFCSVVNNDFTSVYTLGGFCNIPLNIVEKYNVQTNTWTIVNPLKHKKSNLTALMINQRFFIKHLNLTFSNYNAKMNLSIIN